MSTITEGLAELKTLKKRIAKKREFIRANIMRQEMLKDPLADDGGSTQVIAAQRQAIHDLEDRYINIRQAIAKANSETVMTVGALTMTIERWLLWRREIAPGRQEFNSLLTGTIRSVRDEAMRKGVTFDPSPGGAQPSDIHVHINEKELSEQIEGLEETLGTLDGRLSMMNATVTIDLS